MLKWLKNIDANPKIWNENSSFSIGDLFNKVGLKKNMILVHNTFTKKKEIQQYNKLIDKLYWCTCPKSNLYIEGRIPNYKYFKDKKLCIGTDSLASNEELSILEEMKVISSMLRTMGHLA